MEMRIKTDKTSILSREEILMEKVVILKDGNYGAARISSLKLRQTLSRFLNNWAAKGSTPSQAL